MRLLSLLLVIVSLGASAQSPDFTLRDIFKTGQFRQESVWGLRSMNDGIHYTTMEQDRGGMAINKYAYETGEKLATVLSESDLRTMSGNPDANIEDYRFSADEKKMLIAFDQESIYRHSSKEQYYIVDLEKKTASQLSNGPKQSLATFSPDGSRVAYVSENNIYIHDPAKSNTTMITKDGEFNKIINGATDWVYEEEFGSARGFHWSPDGKMIAYYKFDESDVKEFNMAMYGTLYPEDYKFKYPKAGEDNSKVSIYLYELATQKTSEVDLGVFEYIPRIKWTATSEYLAVMKMPRLQNQLEIVRVNTKNLSTKSIYKESAKCYIEISDDLTFLDKNVGFIWRTEKDGFFHFYAYDIDGGNERQITSGNWEVREFMGYDADTKRLFFSASKGKPYNQEIYSVKLDGTDMKLLSPELGNSDASFSNGNKFYILYHSDANTPQTVTLHAQDGTQIRVLKDNDLLKKRLASMDLAPMELFSFETEAGIELNGWMFKPAKMEKKKKYPVLMYVYGGPGSQTVTNSFNRYYWWYQYMANKGYIVVSVDNRGTGARGRDFRSVTYEQLGKYETEDQIASAKYLASLPYVDGERIGIWGWSYGGYMSSLCLSKGAEHFKVAVAVAPVSNWRFYDNIYTERYMGLPSANGNGYDDNSPINHVDKIEGKLLLVHGTADDNVHFQNSVEMVDALIEADKQFDFYIYPNRNHGIYGGNARYHLFTKITDFILTNL